LNRREFLKQGVSATGGIALAGEVKPAASVSVTDHGADPTGRKDSTAAVREAIQKVSKIGGRLNFPRGTYLFTPSTGTILSFSSYRSLTVEGNGSLLKFSGNAQPFLFADCTDIQFADVRIDWQTPPFSQGQVQSVAGTQVDIALDPDYRDNSIDTVEAIGQYARATKLPAPNGIDSYYNVASIQRTSPQLLRLTLKKPLPLTTGMYLVLRHRVYGSNAIVLRKCVNTRISGVTIHAAPGLGLVGLGCTDIALDTFAVTPTPGSSRYMSTCSDGSHFVDCRGSLSINNCSFLGMGDDAVNVFASYWKVEANLAGSYHVSARSQSPIGDWQLPRAGDTLQFVDAVTLAPLQQATVARAGLAGANAVLTASGTGAAPRGALVCNLASTPKLAVADSHFLGNRARGIVAHSDVRIESNTFSGCSMPAILLAPDARWMEGPAVKNVIIRRNHFANCGYAHPGESTGVITISTSHDVRPGPVQEQRVNSDITVTDNTFDPSPVAAIYCAAASNVSLLNNVVSQPASASGAASMALVNTSAIHLNGNSGSSAADIVLDHCSNVDAGTNPHMTVRRTNAT
jgi:hypothetical protein